MRSQHEGSILFSHELQCKSSSYSKDPKRAENPSESESAFDCNSGWIWAQRPELVNLPVVNLPANYALRNWDKSRLDIYPMFRSVRPPVGDIWTLPSGYKEYSNTPGVERRLKGVSLTVQGWSDLSEEITDPLGESFDWLGFRSAVLSFPGFFPSAKAY